MAEGYWVTCPLCRWSTMLDAEGRVKKGKPKRKSFDNFDLDSDFFLQLRNILGRQKKDSGKKGGFYLDDGRSLTMLQALKMREYKGLTDQIYDFCKKFIELADSIKKKK